MTEAVGNNLHMKYPLEVVLAQDASQISSTIKNQCSNYVSDENKVWCAVKTINLLSFLKDSSET